MSEPSLITVCQSCLRVRDSDGTWSHSMSILAILALAIGEVSHGVCPDCLVKAEREVEAYQRDRKAG